jgi:hypothetical protein
MRKAFISTPVSVSTISSLTASRDVAAVRGMIERKYGFTPPDAYIVDLIAFVEALTDGQ